MIRSTFSRRNCGKNFEQRVKSTLLIEERNKKLAFNWSGINLNFEKIVKKLLLIPVWGQRQSHVSFCFALKLPR